MLCHKLGFQPLLKQALVSTILLYQTLCENKEIWKITIAKTHIVTILPSCEF
jgi:hypothetical protein